MTYGSEEISALQGMDRDERALLRRLAGQRQELASRMRSNELAGLWRNLNDRKPDRPMLFINEEPWNELISAEDSLKPMITNPIAREWELSLRKEIYRLEHFPADYIPSPFFAVEKLYSGGSFTLDVEESIIGETAEGAIHSHHYTEQITSIDDAERVIDLQLPVYHREETEALLSTAKDLFCDIIPVELTGIRHIWFTPWDRLIQVWGIEQALMDLVLNPDLVHYALSRYVSQSCRLLDAYEAEGLLSDGSGNTRVGSGGYGYTASLPDDDGKVSACSPAQVWGCSNAQVFSEVSPSMHWEFAIEHDLPWLSRFGANYYGCCEPLHLKTEQVMRIPNLRKASFSPWSKPMEAMKTIGDAIVYSCKPNPAIFAYEDWDLDLARRELVETLAPLVDAGIPVEIIMKDISTVRREPHRLHEWARMASEVVREYQY